MITKKEAADILGIHSKTLERYLKDPAFFTNSGAVKNAINGRVSFHEETFRAYVAGQTGNDDLRQSGTVVDEPEQNALERTLRGPIESFYAKNDSVEAFQPVPAAAAAGPDLLAELKAALLTPHKFLFTLSEAREMTGIPASKLRPISEMIGGRRLIRRDKLLGLSKGRKLI